MFLVALSLLACSGTTKDDTGGDTTGADAHPTAPEGYADEWDIESLGCEDATLYWRFTGTIDSAGAMVGEETWYWFFAEPGWDADCADTFDLSAVEEPTPIPDDACNSCDRDFTAAYVIDEAKRQCPFEGYESLVDNDDVDRIDEEAYTLAIMLDTDPLGGEEGEISSWGSFQDDRDTSSWNDRAVSPGIFTPDTAGDLTGPGTIEWVAPEGLCITIEEE